MATNNSFQKNGDGVINTEIRHSGPLIVQCFKEVSWIVCSLGFRSPSREVGCTAALSECRKVTAWQLAAQLLCQIDLLGLKPDAVTYGAGVSCYGRAAQWERSLALFNRAQQQQIQSLDSRLGSGSAPSSNDEICMDFRPTCPCSKVMKRDAIPMEAPDRPSCNEVNDLAAFYIVKICQDVRCYIDLSQMFFSLHTARFALVPVSVHPYARPNRIICNAAISACEKGSQWEIASCLLRGMTEQQLLPDCISYTAVISCCHKNSLWIAALCLLSEMQQVSISADTIAYNAAISASARAGVWDAVFWICSVGDFLDSPIAYSNRNGKSSGNMFHSYHIYIHLSGPLWHRSKAFGLFNEMTSMTSMRSKLSPDLVTFSALTSACEKGQQWEKALALVQEMPTWLVLPSIITYSALTSALGRGGQWTLAVALYDMIRAEPVTLNEVFCGAMITACSLGNAWEAALHFLSAMPGLELQRNEVTYNAAIGAVEGTPHWQLATLLLEQMAREMVPSTISYQAVMSGCSKAQAWQVAVHVFSRLDPAHLSDGCWAAAISAYHQGSQWRSALQMASQVLGPKSCGAVMAGCGQQGRWHFVVALLEKMLWRQISVNNSHFQAAISACRSWQWSLWLFQKSQECQINLGAATLSMALSTFRSGSQWEMALMCLAQCDGSDGTVHCSNVASIVLALGEASQWQHGLELLQVAP